jgi:hypothetical protein
VVDLLLTVADGRSSDNGTVKSITVTLNLAPAIAAAFTAALVIGIDLVFGVKEVGGELTANYSKLSDATVSKGVKSVIVESAVRVERDGIVVGAEVSEAAISDTCCRTIDDTARQRVRSGVDLVQSQCRCIKSRMAQTYSKTTSSSTHPPVLEFAGRGEPILLEYPVVLACMSVCKRDIAVIKGAVREEGLSTDSGVVNGIGGDGRGVEDVGPVLGKRVANV